MIKDKLNALFSAVKAVFAEMKKMETDRGDLFFEGDELAVGIPIYNEYGPAGDGEYLSGGVKVIVKDGMVAEVVEVPKPEVESVEKVEVPVVEEEKKIRCEEVEEPKMDEPKEEVVEEPKEEPKMVTMEEYQEKITELEDAIKDAIDSINEVKNICTAIDSRVTDMEKQPECGLPKDEFKKVNSNSIESGIEAIKKMKASMRIK